MAVFYGYTNALLGTQTTIDGNPINYAFLPTGSTWQWTGSDTYFVVEENDGATLFNGDIINEQVGANEQIGGAWEQTTDIDGTAQQVIWDYTFTVTDGTTTWRVGVIDVDLNNDNDLSDAGEDGYYLVFPDGMPPADTDLTTGGVVENDGSTTHVNMAAQIVCFSKGTHIETDSGPCLIENLKSGDQIMTKDAGLQSLKWIGSTTVPALGDLAPIVISAGTFGNKAELVVSPQHAILLSDWRAELFFGQETVLIRAKDLLCHDGVYRRSGGMVTYYHILFDAHQIVRSNGMWSESLFPGDMALQSVNPKVRQEISNLFPDLAGYGPRAAPCLRKFEASCLLAA